MVMKCILCSSEMERLRGDEYACPNCGLHTVYVDTERYGHPYVLLFDGDDISTKDKLVCPECGAEMIGPEEWSDDILPHWYAYFKCPSCGAVFRAAHLGHTFRLEKAP